MSDSAEIEAKVDSAKRRQILEGARTVFLACGFDAASMNEIARAAGVSKGTLYVYFADKENLFEAIVEEERRGQAEQVFALDPSDHDVEAVLTRLGRSFARFICNADAVSPLRIVIGIADRMPEVGRKFYEAGPAFGGRRVADYLAAQVAAGMLAIEDCEVAAHQLLDAYSATLFKPMLFNVAGAPDPARIDRVVDIAVQAFLKAYRAPSA